MGVALRAEADDRDGLAVEEGEVRVVVVVHGVGGYDVEMRTITVVNHVSLDGVMQSPRRPDEDESDGFTRGGWATPFADDVLAARMGARMGGEGALLLGRRTYDPLVLGSGRRMFAERGPELALELVEATPTTTGAIVAHYRRV